MRGSSRAEQNLGVLHAGNICIAHRYIQSWWIVAFGLVHDLNTKESFTGWSLHLFCSGWTSHASCRVNNKARCNYGQSQSIHDL